MAFDQMEVLLRIQEQLRGELQHLQDLRAKLITTYFLVLGGTGYLMHLILTNFPVTTAEAVQHPIFWVAGGVLTLLLLALAAAFAARTAAYTDVIRVDLHRIYTIDEVLLRNVQLPHPLPPYRVSSFSTNWRTTPLGWPVGLAIFPLLAASVLFVYIGGLAFFFLELTALVCITLATIFGLVGLGFTASALELLPPWRGSDREPDTAIPAYEANDVESSE